jgi:outer membrane protein, multidrug efflux system
VKYAGKRDINFGPWHRCRSAIVLCALAGGCEVGPDYHKPDVSTPAKWETPATTQASVPVQEPVELERWWTQFDDPELDSLVRRAVQSNLNVEAATERVRQARASLGVAKAGLIPTASSNGSLSRSGTEKSVPQNLWQAGLDAAWEVDVFGGVRRSVEAANANLQASVEDRRDVLVTLLGEVATDYIQLRGLQQEIIIAGENLKAQKRNVDLTKDKQKLGTGTELDVVQAEEQVVSTTATIISFESQEQQAIYALSILLGLPPTALNEELRPPGEIPAPPDVVTVGMPSDLLRRRPDIRRVERQLGSASAQVGVATAQLFPSFSLTGSLGIQASHFGGLGNIGNSFWSFGPSISWPIFNPGIWANVSVQNAVEEQALTLYKQTILNALLETQDGLVAYVKEQERREVLTEAVALDQKALVLARHRYQQGLTDFLAVLVAEQTLLSAQDGLVRSNQAVGIDVVAIYKALGGGWEAGEPATTQSAAR